MDVRVIGSRIETADVIEVRRHLLELAARRPARVGIWTAYLATETFPFLRDLIAAGFEHLQLLLAANGGRRSAWQAARDFATTSGRAASVRIARGHPGSILHPKLIVVDNGPTVGALIGSSNFTPGGLWNNVELNVYLEAAIDSAEAEAISLLHRAFDEAFSRARSPSNSEWQHIIASAPERIAAPEGTASIGNAAPFIPAIGAQLGVIGGSAPGAPMRRRGVPGSSLAASGASYHTLLMQLSDADIRRPPWDPEGVGTNQTNLPREALPLLAIPPGFNGRVEVEAVGVGLLAGTVENREAGLWQRAARGPGLLAEVIRLTFYRDIAEFIQSDIGSPSLGDVCILEVPGVGLSTVNPVRLSVMREAAADALGLRPTSNRRGTHAGRDLFWEVRPGTVL